VGERKLKGLRKKNRKKRERKGHARGYWRERLLEAEKERLR
jgi:hypothetical protein